MASSKIQFEGTRPFGDIIGDSIKFTFGRFSSILVGFLIYVGPLLVISVVTGISFFDFTMLIEEESFDYGPYLWRLVIFSISSLFVAILIFSYSYAVIQKYRDDPEAPLMQDFFPYMRDIVVRMALIFLVFLLLFLVLGLLMFVIADMLSVATAIILGIALSIGMIYVSVPLLLFPYIYINEQLGVSEALRRAFYLVKGNWWSTFGVYFIVSLIGSTISSIIFYPAYIMDLMDMITDAGSGELPMYRPSLFMKASFAASMVVSFFFTILQVVALVLQYFKLREIKEGTSLMDRIDAIELDD